MMADSLILRYEIDGDEAAIDAVLRASFPTPAEAQLVERLRAANRLRFSTVAEWDGQIVGHIGFSHVTTSQGQRGVGLAPLSVLAEYRRQGIGEKLVRRGLAQCQLWLSKWCVVLGDPAYYSRFGFRPAPAFGLSDEYGGGDAFQIVELKPGSMPLNGGLVKYAPEFAIFVE